jgi:hypothetical protein
LLLQGCLLQTHYAKLYVLSISDIYFLTFSKVISLISPSDKLHLSLFYPSSLCIMPRHS